MKRLIAFTALAAAMAFPALTGAELQPRDLTPVTWMKAPAHQPIELVRDGRARAVVFVADRNPSTNLKRLVDELVEVVRLGTGATLERVAQPASADRPAILIGNCEETLQAGIDAGKIPVEGFVVKTAPNRVYLVGSAASLPSNAGISDAYSNEGTAWAVADFLERFVGVRWYWPVQAGGRSVVKATDLAVPPVHYSDAPVFRKRSHHPPKAYGGQWKSRWFDKQHPAPPTIAKELEQLDVQPLLTCLRSGNSWPYLIKVHQPQGFRYWKSPEWFREHAAMFAIKEDGTRSKEMLCYSSKAAFDYLIEGCEAVWDKGHNPGGRPWVTELCVSISPGDEPVNCHCPDCRKLFDPKSPRYGAASGQASKIMGLFVKKVGEEVKRRWPGKKVIYLPYWNYALCPVDIEFPDNLEIEMCTTGFAGLRETPVRDGIEENLRAWSRKVDGRITSWEYSVWVTGWTHGPVQFPRVVQDYYRANRDVLAGSFINGGDVPEWSKTAPTLYCWMKVLWNPDVDIDAILDEMCRRQFGAGAEPSRELLRLMCDRWEKAPWSQRLGAAGRLSPAIFADTWPPEVVAEMKKLWQQAREQMKGDPDALTRFDYWHWTFEAFLKEAEVAWVEAKR